VDGGSTLNVTGTFTTNVGGDFSNGFTKQGNGDMVLSGQNTDTAPVIVNAGRLVLDHTRFGDNGVLAAGANVTVQNTGTLLVNQVNALGTGGVNTPTITVAGSNALMTIANYTNAWTGNIVLQGGTLDSPSATNETWLLGGDITANGVTTSTISAYKMGLCKTGGVTFTVDAGSTLNVTGYFIDTNPLSGDPATGLIKAGDGTMVLASDYRNTFPCAVTVNAGTLAMNHTRWGDYGLLDPSSSVIVQGTGRLLVEATNALGLGGGYTPPITISGSNAVMTTADGVAAWIGNVILQGGTWTCGTLQSGGGTLQSWNINGDVTATGGTTSTMSATHMGLVKTGGVTFTVDGGSVLNVTGSFANDTGHDSNGLTKSGDGTMVLSGANTYGGVTTVNAGTLTVSSTGSVLMDVNPSGPFSQFLGTGTLNLNGLMKLDIADVTGSSGSWMLVDAANLGESYGGTFAVTMADGSPFTYSGGVWTYLDGSRAWFYSESSGTLTVEAVPEPGMVALLATGLMGLLVYAWRKRK
jgi:fibronectin-binding autotransporter adhesin